MAALHIDNSLALLASDISAKETNKEGERNALVSFVSELIIFHMLFFSFYIDNESNILSFYITIFYNVFFFFTDNKFDI